jgi:hypothetical protein
MLHSKLYFGYKYVMSIAAVKCRGDNEATMVSHNDRLLGLRSIPISEGVDWQLRG